MDLPYQPSVCYFFAMWTRTATLLGGLMCATACSSMTDANNSDAQPVGNGWRQLDSPVDAELRDVWASAADDVWIVGHVGTLLHWDGAALVKIR